MLPYLKKSSAKFPLKSLFLGISLVILPRVA